MAQPEDRFESIAHLAIEQGGESVSLESVLLPAEDHKLVTQQFPELVYGRRSLARTALGPLVLGSLARTRFVALQSVSEEWASASHPYTGNAMLSSSRDVFNQQTQHVASIRRNLSVVAFRMSARESVVSSIWRGDNLAHLTGVAATTENGLDEQRQYASLALLSALLHLAKRRTPTTVEAMTGLEQDGDGLWGAIHPEYAGLPAHPDEDTMRLPISLAASDAYNYYRRYLEARKLLSAIKEKSNSR